MYISAVEIMSFRNFRHIEVPLRKGLTVLVGENGIGKTNFLRALGLLFSTDTTWRSRHLTEADFHAKGSRDEALPIIRVRVWLSECKGDSEALVYKWLTKEPGVALLTYEFRPGPKCPKVAKTESIPVDKYEWVIYGGEVERESVDFRDLREISMEILTALRDAEAALAKGRRGQLMRMLNHFDSPLAQKEAIEEKIRALNQELSRSDQICDAETELNTRMSQITGSVYKQETALRPSEQKYESLLGVVQALMRPLGLGFDYLPLEFTGLGYSNILYITAVLVQFEQAIRKQNVTLPVIAVEEPEAHLHPHLEKALAGYLTRTSAQVILTTHSTHISSGTALDSLVLMFSDENDNTRAICVGDCFANSKQEKRDLERYLDATRATLLFGRAVLLVEGISEAILLPEMVKALNLQSLDKSAVSIIAVGGLSFRPFLRLFGEEKIERRCAVLTDGDCRGWPADKDGAFACSRVVDLKKEFASNPYVKVFHSKKTLEYDLFLEGNRGYILKALRETEGCSMQRVDSLESTADNREAAKLFVEILEDTTKGRFAQALAREIDSGFQVPKYIRQALDYVGVYAVEEGVLDEAVT